MFLPILACKDKGGKTSLILEKIRDRVLWVKESKKKGKITIWILFKRYPGIKVEKWQVGSLPLN